MPAEMASSRRELRGLDGCCAVVQPAVLEDQPRKLLRAVAEGLPVIATPACGVSHLPGVTTVPAGDSASLTRAFALFKG